MKLKRFNTLNEGRMKELLYDVVDQVVPKIDTKEYHKAKDKVAFLNKELDNAMKDMEPKTAEYADKFRDGIMGAIMHQMEEAVESANVEEAFDRDDTFQSDEDYKEARKKLDAYQAAVDAWMKANKTNGIPTEVTKDFPHAAEVTNDLRSKVEKFEFLSEEPVKYFVYISEKNKTATTWTGQKLGDVTFGREFRSNMGDKRVPVSVKALNGLNYYGTFFKSAGDYAVIKKSKKQTVQQAPAPLEATNEEQRYYDKGKEKPAKETVQKYYSNGVKHADGNAVTKSAGTGKIKRFADMSKEQKNKADDKKKTKPSVQKVKSKDYLVKGYKMDEKLDLVQISDDLKSNFRSWEQDHDNLESADELLRTLIDRYEPETEADYAKLKDIAYDWVGYAPLAVKFKRWECELQFAEYNNGRTAIELVDKKTGEPVMVATVNIPQEKLADDEIIIKNWSENEGILDVLQKAGIVGETIRKVPTGHVEADVVKLLKKT